MHEGHRVNVKLQSAVTTVQ